MVIDNADDMALFFNSSRPGPTMSTIGSDGNFADYVPNCKYGTIIITTRNKQVGSKLTKGLNLIEVNGMDETESASLLQVRLEGERLTSTDLPELSSKMEYLPLALAQAAAFIQENTMSVDQYLQLLDGDQGLVELLSEDFETVGRDSDTTQAVAKTWMLSFQQIQGQNVLASELLSLMSLFDRQAIPRAFLLNYGERNDSFESLKELEQAVGVLKAFSLISEESGGNLNMHRLVQLVTRKWLIVKKTIGRYEGQAMITMAQLYPFGSFENRTSCSVYLPHANAVLKGTTSGSGEEAVAKGLLLHCMAGYMMFKKKWKDASKLNEQAVKILKQVLGENHRGTLTNMHNLASAYRNQGRWDQAEELNLRVTETRKRILGDENPDTLISMDNLALTYQCQGRWDQAEELSLQIIETHKRVLGEEHPDTLISVGNLASTYRDQGRWDQAEELGLQIIETQKRVLGEEHPGTLISVGNLASIYRDQGRWDQAEELGLQVLENLKWLLGEEHLATLVCMSNLAGTWYESGRCDDAIVLMQHCLRMKVRVLGPDHPDTRHLSKLLSSWRGQSS